MGMASTSSDDQTTSTSYPFYVELDSSENLMLGLHVYIAVSYTHLDVYKRQSIHRDIPKEAAVII